MENKALISMSIDLCERYLDEAHNSTVDDNAVETYENLHKAMDVLMKILNIMATEGEEWNEG